MCGSIQTGDPDVIAGCSLTELVVVASHVVGPLSLFLVPGYYVTRMKDSISVVGSDSGELSWRVSW